MIKTMDSVIHVSTGTAHNSPQPPALPGGYATIPRVDSGLPLLPASSGRPFDDGVEISKQVGDFRER